MHTRARIWPARAGNSEQLSSVLAAGIGIAAGGGVLSEARVQLLGGITSLENRRLAA